MQKQPFSLSVQFCFVVFFCLCVFSLSLKIYVLGYASPQFPLQFPLQVSFALNSLLADLRMLRVCVYETENIAKIAVVQNTTTSHQRPTLASMECNVLVVAFSPLFLPPPATFLTSTSFPLVVALLLPLNRRHRQQQQHGSVLWVGSQVFLC